MPRPIRDPRDLTEEQGEFIRLARDFAEREIRPRAEAVSEADTESPMDLWKAAAQIGIAQLMIPEEYGGGGVTDLVTQALVQQELAYGDISIGAFLTSNGFFSAPIEALGSEEQKKHWLGLLASDTPPVTALATTEPGTGSDAASLQTRARREGDHYVLNGQKTWISNAPYAEYFIVFATVDPTLRSRGITAFVVPRDSEGLEVGKPMRKMGQRGIVNAEVFLDNVRVPIENRLGEEGQGFYGMMATFDASRILIASSATGLARAALDVSLDYAKEREQFGTAIINHQAVAFRLADMATRVDISHLVTMRAASLYDQGHNVTEEAATAKVVASENATWVANAAISTLGGWGYSREFPVERWARDAKLEELEEGTSDIQRLIISRSLARGPK